MDRLAEVRRLREGPRPGETPEVSVDVIVARCPGGDAARVLVRCREVLEIVLNQDPERWPLDSEWYSLIPRWFIDRCGPELSQEEAERYLARRKAMSPEEQVRADREGKWSLLNWIYWFSPDMHLWSWWHAAVEDPSTLYVGIADAEIPHGGGPVDWLLRACGAVQVDEVPLDELPRISRKLRARWAGRTSREKG